LAFEEFFRSQTTYRISLRTKDQAVAMTRFAAADDTFNQLVAFASGVPRDVVPSMAERPDLARFAVTAARLAGIEQDFTTRTMRPWRLMATRAENGGEWRGEFNRAKAQREMDAEGLRSVLIDGEDCRDPRMPDIPTLAADLVEEACLDAPMGSDAFAAVQASIRKGLIAGERAIDRLFEHGEADLVSKPSDSASKSPLLSSVFVSYVATLKATRTIAEVKGAAKALIDVVGDIPLIELNGTHIRSFCEQQGKAMIGTKDPFSVRRPMSAATLKKKVSIIRAAINHARHLGAVIPENPASGIDAAKFVPARDTVKMPKKRPFRVPEINLILAHPWFTGCMSAKDSHTSGLHRLTGMQFWVPIVALMTGLRAGELGGLKVNEIKLEDTHPHIIVRPNEFRPTKSGESRRVPILDCLIELGFAQFVRDARQRRAVRLFDDWRSPQRALVGDIEPDLAWSNSALIRSFNRTVVPAMLGDGLLSGARREVTFHSFRGAFKTMLGMQRHHLPTNYVNEVVGHAKSTLDSSYIGEIPIEETYPAIRGCRYEGLILPKAP
jgi:integrase